MLTKSLVLCCFALVAGCSASAPASATATLDAPPEVYDATEPDTYVAPTDVPPDTHAPLSATVDVYSRGILPQEAHVSRGGSVTFRFHASEELVSGFWCIRDGMWSTGVVPAGESITMAFMGAPGPYPYFLEISCEYAGVVVIDP